MFSVKVMESDGARKTTHCEASLWEITAKYGHSGGFPELKKVLFVCHGNICRSPMAESYFTYLLTEKNWQDVFEVASAATSIEELGHSPHYGTVAMLKQHGVPVISHRATQITKEDYRKYDYIIGMDHANLRNMLRIFGGDPEQKCHLLLSFAGKERDVADPWYTGNFIDTWEDITEGCQALLQKLAPTS